MKCKQQQTAALAASVAAACALAAGCMSIQRMAPPVDHAMAQVAARQGASADALGRGRHIYLSKCITCHTVEPIDRYTIAKWQKIMPDMSDESKLSPGERDDLWAYIQAAHERLMTDPELRGQKE